MQSISKYSTSAGRHSVDKADGHIEAARWSPTNFDSVSHLEEYIPMNSDENELDMQI